jgi:hypothetical protein
LEISEHSALQKPCQNDLPPQIPLSAPAGIFFSLQKYVILHIYGRRNRPDALIKPVYRRQPAVPDNAQNSI